MPACATRAIGTAENPVTEATAWGVSYGGLICKCSICGRVDRCTPTRDFYKRDSDRTLRCEACVLNVDDRKT